MTLHFWGADMCRILVAEDDLAFLTIERFNLARAGYEVVAVQNGGEALEIARAEQFDLVVTDHKMPRMTGVGLCRQIRLFPNYSDTPLVLVTGKAFELDRTRIENELSPIRMLTKPISMSNLLRTLDEILSQAALGQLA